MCRNTAVAAVFRHTPVGRNTAVSAVFRSLVLRWGERVGGEGASGRRGFGPLAGRGREGQQHEQQHQQFIFVCVCPRRGSGEASCRWVPVFARWVPVGFRAAAMVIVDARHGISRHESVQLYVGDAVGSFLMEPARQQPSAAAAAAAYSSSRSSSIQRQQRSQHQQQQQQQEEHPWQQ
jgi:hypothetical protein